MAMANFKRRTWAIASRMILEAHLVIEVCDARDIEGTRIRRLDRGISGKLIISATKSDLCGKEYGAPFTLGDGATGIYCSSRSKDGVNKLIHVLRERARDMAQRGKGRFDPETGRRTIDILIFGIPNVGKSSLINAISGRRAAPTGFRAGITRGPQWISLWPGVRLVDMPGLVDNRFSAQDLALFSALDVEKLHAPEEAAEKIVKRYLESKDPGLFMHYGIKEGTDPEEILASIAVKYGKLLKGGEPNIPEACKFIIRDWQKGKLSWVEATPDEYVAREKFAQAQMPYVRRPQKEWPPSPSQGQRPSNDERPSPSGGHPSSPHARSPDGESSRPSSSVRPEGAPDIREPPASLRPPAHEKTRPSRFYPRTTDSNSSRRAGRPSRPQRREKNYKRPAGRERQHRMHRR